MAGPLGRPSTSSDTPNRTGLLAEDPRHIADRPSLFVLDMFPYPSGVGLHVGHPLGFIATDVYARFQRMNGFNVLHAMGYDAFGLPAEQYAVQTGTHPRVTTEQNIANMKRQLRALGLGHDPRRGPGHHRRATTTAGRSGSSCRSTTPGTTTTPTGPGRSRELVAGAPRRPVRRPPTTSRSTTLGVARATPSSSTRTGSRTSRTRRSTGARVSAPCSPTKRSPPTAAASAATSRCTSVR